MSGFTDLEKAALGAICDGRPAIARQLRSLLATMRLAERENTGHGFYTCFDVDKGQPPVVWPTRTLEGPTAEVAVDGKTLLMGFVLWLEDGFPTCLEGFQYGTPEGEEIDLKLKDLAALVWTRPVD
ncbi:hypothetical protein V7S57_17280 [Caulobacter sp. CCNWLY153]|uniref:Uncharacterized protein n=1 Tax=Caulobacter radicis TaxID=2172650 RepID=A0A2T9J0G2_9CAUL|nr:hypothetical protein [Caulobacter radicis]PVM73294.1 hypothetical protein DDF65_21265 [Caulobacter radicis]